MKTIQKIIAVGLVGVVTMATMPAATHASDYNSGRRDQHDNNAAAIIAGIAAVGAIVAIANHHDADVSISYGHCPPPPPRCGPARRWIPGHYEVRRENVVHPGYWDTVCRPAEYGWVRHGHRWSYVIVKPECRERIWVPERCEVVEQQVWVPGGYAERNHYARAY